MRLWFHRNAVPVIPTAGRRNFWRRDWLIEFELMLLHLRQWRQTWAQAKARRVAKREIEKLARKGL
jgi:hypothetical protein